MNNHRKASIHAGFGGDDQCAKARGSDGSKHEHGGVKTRMLRQDTKILSQNTRVKARKPRLKPHVSKHETNGSLHEYPVLLFREEIPIPVTTKSLKQIAEDIDAKLKAKRAIPRSGPQQLPLWRDHLRGLPNAMARSALFTCANRRAPRAEFKREKIATVAGYVIYYTGTELRQDDEDVFLQIVHFARIQPLGDTVEISGNALLRALGWNSGSKSYVRLREIIERLKEGTIKISNENGKEGYAGSLIRKFAWQSEDASAARTKWKIYLEKEIIALFADDAYTLLDWDDRTKLGHLAKWLHSFYYTHQNPIPYKVATLHKLSGSKSNDMGGFRRDLKAAHDELLDIGFLNAWKHSPETDTISVIRKQTRVALSS